MSSPLATVPQLVDRMAGVSLATMTQEDVKRAEAALSDASDLVREEAQQEWPTPAVVPAAVIGIVLKVARRDYDNPEGFTTETAGPFSRARKSDDVTVYLTEKEAEIVRRYRPSTGGGVAGLWALPTTRGECGGTGYVYTDGSLDPVPWYPEEW